MLACGFARGLERLLGLEGFRDLTSEGVPFDVVLAWGLARD